MNKLTLTTLLLGLSIAATPAALADSYRDRDHRGDRHGPRHERQEHQREFRQPRRGQPRAEPGHRFESRAERHRYRDGYRAQRHAWRDGHHARRHAWREERRAWRHHRPYWHDRGHGFGSAPRYGHYDRGYAVRYGSRGRHDRTLPIIAGGVIGGLIGSDLGQGDPGAATRGLIVGSVLGYALTH